CIAAKPHSQPGCDAGRDFVAEKDRRGRIERTASRVELGERLTLDVLDRADPLGGARRYDGKNERDRQRSVAEKPASIAGPVAFDLSEVGHRRSPSAWCSREQCLSVVVSLKRFDGLGSRTYRRGVKWILRQENAPSDDPDTLTDGIPCQIAPVSRF